MSKTVTYIKTSSFNNKMSQIMASLVLLIVVLNIAFSIIYKGDRLLEENAQVLADNLLLQTSHSASWYIISNDIHSLEHLTESALKSEYIYEMVIYDTQGIVLSQSNSALPTKERFSSTSFTALQHLDPIPYVSEIEDDDGNLLGYVRVTLLRAELQETAINVFTQISKQIAVIILIAMLIGYLLTNGLKPFSTNSFVVKN